MQHSIERPIAKGATASHDSDHPLPRNLDAAPPVQIHDWLRDVPRRPTRSSAVGTVHDQRDSAADVHQRRHRPGLDISVDANAALPGVPSAHSVQSAAVGRSLDDFYAGVAFTDHSHDALGFEPRQYSDHWEAFEETAISRLYGGIHFRSAIYEGLDQGTCIADRVRALVWERPH